ncbi:MAG TPA: hypothetical protein DEH02_03525 [Bacteroidales bacterium]|nr:MAG: hypothetical protein A2X01_14825 [Bacteroidetes bacterium GWF2_35_48]OFY97180.1 MAG: hypothetical protein A2491_21440 [Bacteroidetes bacterium RIFOXYC12_FULL_35_7]HBX50121.1 hypothetical protein [Bacteroidales bacterium]
MNAGILFNAIRELATRTQARKIKLSFLKYWSSRENTGLFVFFRLGVLRCKSATDEHKRNTKNLLQ